MFDVATLLLLILNVIGAILCLVVSGVVISGWLRSRRDRAE